MFKKTEESEWTRFSRALGSKEQPRDREETVVEPDDEPIENSSSATAAASPSQTREPIEDAAPPDPSAHPIFQPNAPPVQAQSTRVPSPATTEPADPDQLSAGSMSGPPEPQTFGPSAFSSDTVSPREMAAEDSESVIGSGTEVEGQIRAEHSIRILGVVQGELSSKRRIVVEQGARVSAKVSAEQIAIFGEVNGEVVCPGRVEIAPNGRVTGEISARSLVMQEGGFFEGSLKMLNKGGPTEGS